MPRRTALAVLALAAGCALQHPARSTPRDATVDEGADGADGSVPNDRPPQDAAPPPDAPPDAPSPLDAVDAAPGDAPDALARDAPDDLARDASDAADATGATDAADAADARDAADAPPDVVRPDDAAMDAPDDAAVDAPDDAPAAQDAPLDASPVTVALTPSDRCAMAPEMRADDGVWVYEGTTVGSTTESRGTCNAQTATRGDVVYALTLRQPRRVAFLLEATRLDRTYNPVLYVSRTCAPRVANADGTRELEVLCADDDGASLNPRATAVLPEGTYRVWVDGNDLAGRAGEGSFRLTVTITPPPPSRVEVVAEPACAAWPVPATQVPGTTGDDVVSPALTMPLSLRWFGVTVARYAVSSNGYVQLDPPAGVGSVFVNQALPATTAPNAVIAPWWDDLRADVPVTARVESALWGVAPARVLAFRWRDLSRFGEPTTRFTFEARLLEASQAVEFHYCTTLAATASSLASATLGVESHDGLEGAVYALDEDRMVAGRVIRFSQP